MSTHALNMDFYEKALLAKAGECRGVVLTARQDIWGTSTRKATDPTLLAAEREIAAGRVERCYEMLRQIEAALFRLKRGRHGLCLKCEEPIEQNRLDALPWALFCTGCQDRIDSFHNRAQARQKDIRQAA